MKDAIDVAFIDQKGVVLSSFQNVQPSKRLRNRKAHTVLERFHEETPWLTAGETLSMSGQTPTSVRGSVRGQTPP